MNKKHIAITALIAVAVMSLIWFISTLTGGTKTKSPVVAATITNAAPTAVTNAPPAVVDSSPQATIDSMPDVWDLVSTETWSNGSNIVTHTRTMSPEEGQFRLREKELDLRGAKSPRFAGEKRAMASPPPLAFPSFTPTVVTQMVTMPPVVVLVTNTVTKTITLPAPKPVVVYVTNTVTKTVSVPAPVTPAKAKPVPAPKAKVCPTPAPTPALPVVPAQAPSPVNLQVNVFGGGSAVVSTNTPYWKRNLFTPGW